MNDKFYEACEKHSVRRCMVCKLEHAAGAKPEAVIEIVSTGIRDRDIPVVRSYTEKVKTATEQFLLAYSNHQAAMQDVTEAKMAIINAEENVQTSHATREKARNDLFDLISETREEAKAA